MSFYYEIKKLADSPKIARHYCEHPILGDQMLPEFQDYFVDDPDLMVLDEDQFSRLANRENVKLTLLCRVGSSFQVDSDVPAIQTGDQFWLTTKEFMHYLCIE